MFHAVADDPVLIVNRRASPPCACCISGFWGYPDLEHYVKVGSESSFYAAFRQAGDRHDKKYC